MMAGNKVPTIQLPLNARQAMWRIFGNGLAPKKQQTWHDLVGPIIQSRLGKTDEAERAVAEIQSWFDPDGGANQLSPDMSEPVAEMIIDGIGRALSDTTGFRNHDTAFWAMGSIAPDVSAAIIRSSWRPEQIDAVAAYVLDTLESLHEKGEIIDPRYAFGREIQGVRVRSSEKGHYDSLRAFHIGPETAFHAYRTTYPGIASIVHLLLELKPEMLPELVERVQDPLLQSFGAFCVAGTRATSDHRQPLRWITDTSPAALIALAVLHILEIARKAEMASATVSGCSAAETPDPTTLADPISDLASSLAALGPARSTWWAFELLNHTYFGPDEKRSRAELFEQHFIQLLEDVVLHHWSDEVIRELESGLRRARFEPRGKPLADITWAIRGQQPEKAARIACILLDEHERHTTAALEDDLKLPYLSGRWSHQDWLTALAAAVVIHHEGIDPVDWAIEKCKALPLSPWDADEEGGVFRAADQVAQTQMTIALYAVQLLADVGRTLHSEKLRAFAEQVWAHMGFVRRYSDSITEDSVAAELAARLSVVLGEPDQEWLLGQAKNPTVDPLTFWALLDQVRLQCKTSTDVGALVKIRELASHRFINPVEVNPRSAPHLANLWLILDAPREAAKTAEVLLTYHPIRATRFTHADRAHTIAALKMMALAESRGELADDLFEASRSLYDSLWGPYTPSDETHAQQEIDVFLNQAAPEGDSSQATE